MRLVKIISLLFLCYFSKANNEKIITDKNNITHHTTTKNFYVVIKKKLYNYTITKKLYDAIFISPEQNKILTPNFEYKNKTIGNITIKRLPVFKQKQKNKNKDISKFFKSISSPFFIKTKKNIVQQKLNFLYNKKFKSVYSLDSIIAADSLATIKMVSITAKPRPSPYDTVDITVVTKDKNPFMISPILALEKGHISLEKAGIQILHNNFFGLGHQWNNHFIYKKKKKKLNWETSYLMPNIGNTYTDIKWQYITKKKKYELKQLEIVREDVDCNLQYIGGFKLNKTTQHLKNSCYIATSYQQAGWFGKIFKKKRQYGQYFFTGKLSHENFIKHPPITIDNQVLYQQNIFLLGNIGIIKKKQYTQQLLTGFGHQETIPYGNKVSLIAGYQFGAYIHRSYIGLNIEYGHFLKKTGYWYGKINIGSFITPKQIQQSIINAQIHHFTKYFQLHTYGLRIFLDMDCLFNLHNMKDSALHISNDKCYRHFRHNNTALGTHRFRGKLEAALFTPWHFLNFHLAIFGSVQYTILSKKKIAIKYENIYPIFSFGIRLKNDKLKVNTISLKFMYYPTVSHSKIFGMDFQHHYNIHQFIVGEPKVVLFKEFCTQSL